MSDTPLQIQSIATQPREGDAPWQKLLDSLWTEPAKSFSKRDAAAISGISVATDGMEIAAAKSGSESPKQAGAGGVAPKSPECDSAFGIQICKFENSTQIAAHARSAVVRRSVFRQVRDRLRLEHIASDLSPDEIRTRSLRRFVDQIDPHRLYLTQQEVQSFMRRSPSAEEMLLNEKFQPAKRLYNKVVSRIRMMAGHSIDELSKPIDVTGDEHVAHDRGKAPRVTSEGELETLWRAYARDFYVGALAAADGGTPEQAALEATQAYESTRAWAQFPAADTLHATLMTAWLTSLDPHTAYLPPAVSKAFVQKLRPAAAPDSPPEVRNGSRVTSQVLTVQHKGVPRKVGFIHLPVFYSPTAGTQASVLPGGAAMDVFNAQVNLLSKGVDAFVLDLRQNPGGVTTEAQAIASAYIPDIVGSSLSAQLARQAALQVPDSAAPAAASTDSVVTKPFDSVIYSLALKGQIDNFRDMAELSGPALPMGVLVSRDSGSASEIVAAALQDHQAAVIMGERTWGKGSAQMLKQLQPIHVFSLGRRSDRPWPAMRVTSTQVGIGSAKVTVGRIHRPSGKSTQIHGVEPDVKMNLGSAPWVEGERDMPNHLSTETIEPLGSAASLTAPLSLDEVRAEHYARVAQIVALKQFEDAVANYALPTTRSLNLEIRRQEVAAQQASAQEIFNLIKETEKPTLEEAAMIVLDTYAPLLTPRPSSKASTR